MLNSFKQLNDRLFTQNKQTNIKTINNDSRESNKLLGKTNESTGLSCNPMKTGRTS